MALRPSLHADSLTPASIDRHRYQLASEPLLQCYLKKPYFLGEDDLFELSLKRESREDNSALKERLK